MSDQGNPEIRVELTEPDVLHCFRLHLGEASVLLHARDLADLAHKANLALLDWISTETGLLIGQAFSEDPRLREAAALLGIDLERRR